MKLLRLPSRFSLNNVIQNGINFCINIFKQTFLNQNFFLSESNLCSNIFIQTCLYPYFLLSESESQTHWHRDLAELLANTVLHDAPEVETVVWFHFHACSPIPLGNRGVTHGNYNFLRWSIVVGMVRLCCGFLLCLLL